MDKKTKQHITSAGLGAVLGAGVTYSIIKNNCNNCNCGNKEKDIEDISKAKQEYLEHKLSNKCFTNPCETCPHK